MKQGRVYLDPREGSGKLAEPLRHLGLPVTSRKLESADVAFLSHDKLRIGIEIKLFGDFYSSLRTGRLAGHQVGRLVQDYDRRYLILEGIWRVMPNGLIGIRRGRLWATSWFRGGQRLRAEEMDGYLTTLEERAGICWRRTTGQWETLRAIATLHRWWTSKPLAAHKSHLAVHRKVDPALFSKPTLAKRWAAELPGVGWDRATAIAAHFSSAQALVLADEKTWQQVKGIGRTLSKRIVAAIEKGEKGE